MQFKSLNISDIQLGHSVEIDPSSGRASIGVRIPLPQGRAAFSPSLSLAYSSTPKNSLYGLGWGLSGISAFSLDTKKGLPKYDGSDTYSFNADALVPYNLPVGTEWKQRTDEETDHWIFYYRPKYESSFTRCEQWVHKITRAIHWRTRSKDNVISIFGQDSSGDTRIADPHDPRRIFQWLIEAQYDQKGNAIIYKYKKEDGDLVDFLLPYETQRKKRSAADTYAQKYPERILYCNTRPLAPGSPVPADNQWLFELVFDYGNYPNRPFTTTEPLPAAKWPVRADPFSVYFPGFEVRTYRLCRRLLVYHHFTELGVPASLTGIFQCNYNEQEIGTTMQSVTYTGVRRDLNTGNYSEISLPPLLFDYSRPHPGTSFQPTVQETNENFIQGFSLTTKLIDLFGEGLPGILTETPAAWYYKPNYGNGFFGQQEIVIEKPSQLGGSYALGDFDQSGNLKLFTLLGRMAGYYEYDRDLAAWSGFVAFEQIPQVSYFKFIDVNGDGLPDLLVEREDKIICYPFKGKEGFGEPYEFSKPVIAGFAPVIGENRSLDFFLADMTGDGLPDQVRIRNGRVEYYPNLGNGRFGEAVVMENSPVIDFEGSFDAARVRLYDLDGSGTNDLIYIGRGEIRYWHNASGNKFLQGGVIANLPYIDNAGPVAILDFLGKGSPCLVWSNSLNHLQSSAIQYLELTSGIKARLLNFVDNSMGNQVLLEYNHSSLHYLRDKNSTDPWISKLPFHFTLVDKKEIVDQVGGTKLITRYKYRDGFYNGKERMFMTFGLVEQYDTELSETTPAINPEGYTQPSCMKSWFYSGIFGWDKRRAEQFWKGDPQQSMLPVISFEDDPLFADDFERALLSLARRPIRRELFAASLAGQPETDPCVVSQTGYRIRRLQPASTKQDGCYFAFLAETVQSHYEEQVADPRIMHHLNIAVSKHGDIEKELQVSYARRAGAAGMPAEQLRDHITISTSMFVHADRLQQYRAGTFYEAKHFEVNQLAHAPGVLISWHDASSNFDQLVNTALPYASPFAIGAVPQARLLSWGRTYYWNDLLNAALPLGEAGSKAFCHHEEEACFHDQFINLTYSGKVTPAMLSGVAEGNFENRDGYWWQKGPINHLRAAQDFFTADSMERGGSFTRYTYDNYLMNVTGILDAAGNQLRCEVDYNIMSPYRVTDYNDNIGEVLYDALGVAIAGFHQGSVDGALYGSGRLAAHAVPADPNFNDILNRPDIYLQQANRYFFYDLHSWSNSRQPLQVLQLVREEHVHDGNGNINNATGIQQQVEYLDGFGRTLQKKIKAEAGGAISKLPDGTIARDAAGDPVQVPVAGRWMVSGHAVYNNKGDVIRQYDPFFSATVAFENEADLQRFGTSSLTSFDAMGRAYRIDYADGSFSETKFSPWEIEYFDQNDTVDRSLYKTFREFLPAGDPQKMALDKSLAHRDTPQKIKIDPRGREIANIRINNNGTETKTEKKYDLKGKLIEITDARDLTAFIYVRDMLGRVLYDRSIDAGERWNFYDSLNHAIHHWNGRSIHQRTYFDALDRMVRIHIDGALGLDQDVQLFVYGDDASVANAKDRNLRGQLMRQHDQAGILEIQKYTPQGEALVSTRRLLDQFTSEANWNNPATVQLAPETYTSRHEYDALGRVKQQDLPDQATRKFRYHQGGGVRQLLLTTGNGQFNELEILKDASYNAKTMRLRTVLGNDTELLYSYDEPTSRLLKTRSRRITGAPRTYQDIDYTFDPAGNLIFCIDNAQQPASALPHVIAGLAVSASSEFTYDALYQLTEAKGRVHQALLPHDYRFNNGPAGVWTKGTRHIDLNNGAAIERYTQSYTYDVSGNIRSIRHQGTTQNWTTQFSTSANSNRTVPMHDLNGVLIAGDPEDHFDANGNCTDLPHLRSIEWNYRNNISKVVLIDRSAEGRPDDVEFYVYGGEGIRVRKITQRLLDAVAGTVELVEKIYLPGCEIKRIVTGGTEILKRFTSKLSDGKNNLAFVHTWQKDDRARETDNIAQSKIHYQLVNHLGSACLELDAAGEVITYEEYFPFGGSSFLAGRNRREIDMKDYRYCGKERDDFTGLYYFGYRYYAHFIGGWLSPDPLGPKDSENLYLYVHNNPVILVDPNGLQSTRPPLTQRSLHGTPVLPTAEAARRYFEGMEVERFGQRVRVHVISVTPSTEPGVDWDVEARFTPVRPPRTRSRRRPRPTPAVPPSGGAADDSPARPDTPPGDGPPGTTGTGGTGGTGATGTAPETRPSAPPVGADGGTSDSSGTGTPSDTGSGGTHDGTTGSTQPQTNGGGGGGNTGEGPGAHGAGPPQAGTSEGSDAETGTGGGGDRGTHGTGGHGRQQGDTGGTSDDPEEHDGTPADEDVAGQPGADGAPGGRDDHGSDERSQPGRPDGRGQQGGDDRGHDGQGATQGGPTGGPGTGYDDADEDDGGGYADGSDGGTGEHWLDTLTRWAGYLNLEFGSDEPGESGGIPGAINLFGLDLPMWLRRIMQVIYIVTTVARALLAGLVRWIVEVVIEKGIMAVVRWLRDLFSSGESIFDHEPTSGAVVTEDEEYGTYLVGAYPPDLQFILSELDYPVTDEVDFDFPVPDGQKFNLLNVSDEAYDYWRRHGGFFNMVNAPWIDAAVRRGNPIIVMSHPRYLYDDSGNLTGFGKEIHRLEWVHHYRYDVSVHRMVPGRLDLPALTREGEFDQPPIR